MRNYYIDALTFAANELDKGKNFTAELLIEHLVKSGHEVDLSNSMSKEKFDRLYRVLAGGPPISKRLDSPAIMTIDTYFKLLEYQELHEARHSSKVALWCATIAILLNVASIMTSIVLSNSF